jgi:general secretion pathway protein M
MSSFFANLDGRERLTLLLGVGALALILSYLLVLEPFYSNRDSFRQEISAKEAELAWMHMAAREVRQIGRATAPAGGPGRTRSPLSAIDGSARQLGLGQALKRVEPAGRDEVRVWLEEAPFDEIMRWLALLKNTHGIEAAEVVVENGKRGTAYVNSRMTLVQGP